MMLVGREIDYEFDVFLCDELGLDWLEDFDDDTNKGWWECLDFEYDDFETFLDDELGSPPEYA